MDQKELKKSIEASLKKRGSTSFPLDDTKAGGSSPTGSPSPLSLSLQLPTPGTSPSRSLSRSPSLMDSSLSRSGKNLRASFAPKETEDPPLQWSYTVLSPATQCSPSVERASIQKHKSWSGTGERQLRRSTSAKEITSQEIIRLRDLIEKKKELKHVNMPSPELKREQTKVTREMQFGTPQKDGFLQYLRDSGAWLRVWCHLKDGILYVFESEDHLEPLESIPVGNSTVKETQRNDCEFCFEITWSGRHRILRAEEEYTYFTWIVTLRGAKSHFRNAAKDRKISVMIKGPIPGIGESCHVAASATSEAPQGSASAAYPSHTESRNANRDLSSTPFADIMGLPTAVLGDTELDASTPDEAFEKEGWVAVFKGKVVTSWKKKYAVLRDGQLTFRKRNGDPSAKEIRNAINVLFCSAKVVQNTKRKYTFVIMETKKTHLVAAESGAEMLDWLTVIQEAQARLMSQHLQYELRPMYSPTAGGSSPLSQRSASISAMESSGSSDIEAVTLELSKSKSQLSSILARPENAVCVDCGGREPIWASINLGVFMCIECSGIHRRMGVHISKVRSVTMDRWDQEVIDFMSAVGNAKANQYWEANLAAAPRGLLKPPPNATPEEREKFIRAKYEEKLFAMQGTTQPSPATVLQNITNGANSNSLQPEEARGQ